MINSYANAWRGCVVIPDNLLQLFVCTQINQPVGRGHEAVFHWK